MKDKPVIVASERNNFPITRKKQLFQTSILNISVSSSFHSLMLLQLKIKIKNSKKNGQNFNNKKKKKKIIIYVRVTKISDRDFFNPKNDYSQGF